jgi:hypothetical protein
MSKEQIDKIETQMIAKLSTLYENKAFKERIDELVESKEKLITRIEAGDGSISRMQQEMIEINESAYDFLSKYGAVQEDQFNIIVGPKIIICLEFEHMYFEPLIVLKVDLDAYNIEESIELSITTSQYMQPQFWITFANDISDAHKMYRARSKKYMTDYKSMVAFWYDFKKTRINPEPDNNVKKALWLKMLNDSRTKFPKVKIAHKTWEEHEADFDDYSKKNNVSAINGNVKRSMQNAIKRLSD